MEKFRSGSNAVSPSTKIGENTKIGLYSVIGYPEVKDKVVKIGNECIIGNHVTVCPRVKIGNGVIIGDHSFISENAVIENGVFVDTHAFIGENATIGGHSSILYGTRIYNDVKIGNNSKISGFIAENASIGNHVAIFGKVIHSFRDPTHWNGGEKTPEIKDFVVVGFDAIVIGDVKVQHHVYITAAALVSKDVPPYSVVTGCNKIIPFKDWKGQLKWSKFWEWNE
ncbi:MAG: DapH/DapD/GlmU-related protein [Bacteroidota bacterium]|nr:hypothetical protein [Patescibacteria group bacterium]